MSEENRELNLEELEKVAGGAGGTTEKCPLGTHVLESINKFEVAKIDVDKVSGCDVTVYRCSTCRYMVFFLSGCEVSKETFYNTVNRARTVEALLKTWFPGIKQ